MVLKTGPGMYRVVLNQAGSTRRNRAHDLQAVTLWIFIFFFILLPTDESVFLKSDDAGGRRGRNLIFLNASTESREKKI